MKVSELMTRNVHCCRADQSASDAARMMWELDLGCIPIVDGDQRPIGIITDRDICMASFTRDLPPSRIPIRSVMATDLAVCDVTDSLAHAESTMRARQLRRLPVVDEQGVLVGIVTLSDIVLARSGSLVRKAKSRLLGDGTDTLAAVVRPRAPTVGAQA